MANSSKSWSGLVAVALSSALFGTIGLFVNRVDSLPFTAILAYRFLFSGLAFAAIAFLSATWRSAMRPQRELRWHYVGLGVAIATMNLAYYYAILTVGMGLATILIATAPVFVTIANWGVWHQKPSLKVAGGMAVGFLGVALVVGADAARSAPLGVAAGIAAGAAFAVWMLVSRVATARGATGASLALGSVTIGTLLIAPPALLLTPAIPSFSGWIALAVLGIVIGAGAVLLLEIGLRSVDAVHAGILSYLEPVIAVSLGVLVLHESYTPLQIAGSLLVITGMIIVNVGHRHGHAHSHSHRDRHAARKEDKGTGSVPQPGDHHQDA